MDWKQFRHQGHIATLQGGVGGADSRERRATDILPRELNVLTDNDTEPKPFLGQKTVTKGGTTVQQSLIKREGSPIKNVAWEDGTFILSQLPEFSLEDKADIIEDGVIRNPEEELGQLVPSVRIGPRRIEVELAIRGVSNM